MSRVVRLAAATAAALILTAPVLAADYEEPPPPPRFESRPGWVPPPRVVPPTETCRVFVKRRIDPYGDEVVRRVRVCDEGPALDGPPRWRGPGWRGPDWGPDEEGPPRRRLGPPLPPADIPDGW
ncbi:hypothetical protein [Methylobacterium oryzisoli]|uniref:hypothetical protein n=1 Tax=Methylobacterium oryzisoli TaxID=3385502 RepID=UPI0038919F76